jgi:hypothetical protein
MGFLNGRVSFARFQVSGSSPLPFGDDLIGLVEQHAIGRHVASDPVDGVAFGWSGGSHVLDVDFDLAKNVINDSLHLAIRIDTDKVPSSLLKAYTQIETDARAKMNPSGFATKSQRQEAKEAAIARAESESADGRFKRLRHYPLLWDAREGILYAGSTSGSVLERLLPLFRETFDRVLEPITAGTLAVSLGESGDSPEGHGALVDRINAAPRLVVVGNAAADAEPAGSAVAWSGSDPMSLDYLGNEFLLWLWHTLQNDGDTMRLADDSEATVMLAKTLTLDCPRGETGRDCLTGEVPNRLPEAFRAIQSGKLPRKAGLVIVRHGVQYDLTLQAESFAVSGANLPKPDDEGLSAHDVRSARIDSLRHLSETLDLLFDAFRRRRTGSDWSGELGRIRSWLQAA